MTSLTKILAVAVIGGGIFATAIAAQASPEADMSEAQAATQAKLSYQQAGEAALQRVPGHVIGVEFDADHNQAVWEVEVVDANGDVHELEIDANSGEVVKQELDD